MIRPARLRGEVERLRQRQPARTTAGDNFACNTRFELLIRRYTAFLPNSSGQRRLIQTRETTEWRRPCLSMLLRPKILAPPRSERHPVLSMPTEHYVHTTGRMVEARLQQFASSSHSMLLVQCRSSRVAKHSNSMMHSGGIRAIFTSLFSNRSGMNISYGLFVEYFVPIYTSRNVLCCAEYIFSASDMNE